MMYGHLLNKRVAWKGQKAGDGFQAEVVAICDGTWGWDEIFSCEEARIEYGKQTNAKRHKVVEHTNKPLVVLRVQKTPKTWEYLPITDEDTANKLVVVGDANFRLHIGDLRGVALDCRIGSSEYNTIQDRATGK